MLALGWTMCWDKIGVRALFIVMSFAVLLVASIAVFLVAYWWWAVYHPGAPIGSLAM